MGIVFKEYDLYNAKIKFSWLGIDEDGQLKFQIGFDYEKGTISTAKRFINMNEIKDLLNVLCVSNYEDLPRKFARIKISNKQIISIGNIIEDKWVELTYRQ